MPRFGGVPVEQESGVQEETVSPRFGGIPTDDTKAKEAVASPQPEPQDSAQERPSALQPTAAVPLEFMAAFNRGATKLADFLTTDQINAVAQVLGSEFRVPSITESLGPATRGGFMEEGLTRDVVGAAGEVIPAALAGGAGLTQAAARLPASQAGVASRLAARQAGGRAAAAPVIAPTESTAAGVVRQMGAAAPGADVAFGAASASGGEIGEELGGDAGRVAGAFLAPIGTAAGKYALDQALALGGRGIAAISRSVEDMSEEGAATLLADAMVRENLSPDDVAKRIADLGPEALPADVGVNFARLLRTASNIVPRIEGEAGRVLGGRQARQGARLQSSFDDSMGIPKLSLEDEVIRLDKTVKPKIDELYKAATEKPFQPSQRLRVLLEGDNSVGRAAKAAQSRLADKRAAGDEITNFDLINATKQELDDQIGAAIRQGENNKARDLIRLKNVMVDEADQAIPEYKQARDLYAGRQSMENASELGEQFFKMKPRDIESAIQSMGDSERRFFRLGAKQALQDKLDTMQISRDAVKALFGKGGDVKKLRSLFDSDEQFDKFAQTMEREANFILTRRAAQANSTTAKQLYDEKAANEALNGARDILAGAVDPTAAAGTVGRLFAGLGAKKGTEANIRSLEKAGDILLEAGMSPEKIVKILKRGSQKEVADALKAVLPKEVTSASRVAIGTGAEAQTQSQ
jgi:hypothetical protein